MVTTEKTIATADAVKVTAVAATPAPAKIEALVAPVPAKATPVPVAAAPKVAAKRVARKPAVAKPAVAKPAVAKPAVKAPAKAVVKAPAKAPTQAVVKAVVKALAKPVAKPKAEKLVKAKKPKLVRDSFTIPKAEYTVLDDLKQRAGKLASPVKKSELIRAGIKALAAMSDAAFLVALKAVPAIKTGRPSKE
jgi:hypothetical protein